MRWVLYGVAAIVGLVVVAVIVLLLWGGGRGESRLQATVEISRPAPVVFDWITEPPRLQTWIGWLIEVRRLTPGETRAGSREVWVMEDRNNNNQLMEIQTEIVGFEENRLLAARVQVPEGFTGTITYDLDPVTDGRTRLQYVGDYQYEHWLAKLLKPLIERSAQAKLEEDLARLKQLVEAE